ncbi:MAG: hypothetical protein ABFD00_04185 [Chloroherpetonaceae bacterium]
MPRKLQKIKRTSDFLRTDANLTVEDCLKKIVAVLRANREIPLTLI